MDEDNTWIVCKHVINGTTEKVHIRKDNVCMCLACTEDPTLLETEEIHIIEEPLLMERLKLISQSFKNEYSDNDNI